MHRSFYRTITDNLKVSSVDMYNFLTPSHVHVTLHLTTLNCDNFTYFHVLLKPLYKRLQSLLL